MHTPAGFAPDHRAPAALLADSYVFAWRSGEILVGGSIEAPLIPRLAEIEAAGLAGATHYLGQLGGTSCIALSLPEAATEPAAFRYSGLRALFVTLPEPLLALSARSFQIVEWDRTHRFCGRCATPMHDKAGERARECPACGLIAYPRISPAMMALVTRGNQVLLARAHRFPPGMYSALAGFVEPGETIEDCLHREVREEVGIKVHAPVYFGSQSWAFPHSLMIAYTAEYAGGRMRPDDTEIEDARWFTPSDLPQLPSPVSIARRLIEATLARLRG